MVITGRVAMPKGCTKIGNRDDDEIFTLAPIKNHPGFVRLVVSVSDKMLSYKLNTTESDKWLFLTYANGTTSNTLNNRQSEVVCAVTHVNRYIC